MVPRAGFEPAQSLDHEILSLARIPISPPRPYLPNSPTAPAVSVIKSRYLTERGRAEGNPLILCYSFLKTKPQSFYGVKELDQPIHYIFYHNEAQFVNLNEEIDKRTNQSLVDGLHRSQLTYPVLTVSSLKM